MNTLSQIAGPIGIGVIVFLLLIWLSEKIFGDLTKKDSYKPLILIIPAMIVILSLLIYFTM